MSNIPCLNMALKIIDTFESWKGKKEAPMHLVRVGRSRNSYSPTSQIFTDKMLGMGMQGLEISLSD